MESNVDKTPERWVLALALALNAATATSAQSVPRHVPSESALAALAAKDYATIVRDGYMVAGDAPSLEYVSSLSVCPRNAGVGDGGSQIRSADGKCWIANFGSAMDIREWGAACNGVTNDALAVNAALAAAGALGGGVVLLPPGSSGCVVASTIAIPAGVTLKGYNQRGSFMVAGMMNMAPMIQFQGDGSTVSDLTILANRSGANTSGATIAYAAAGYERVDRVLIVGPCIGLDIIGNTAFADAVTINSVNHGGCYGIRVGHTTTHGGTVDLRLSNITVGGAVAEPSTAALDIEDAGGLYATNLDLLFAVDGTLIKPGANQVVQWAFFDNTVLGDTTAGHGLHVDTGSPSGVVEGVSCQGCWIGTSGSSGLAIDNTAHGTISGVHFSNLRLYLTTKEGAAVHAGSDVTFDTSWFCSIPDRQPILYWGPGVSRGAVRNSTLGNCDNANPVIAGVGIVFTGANADMLVTGNDLTGTKTSVQGVPIGDSVVQNNKGIDTHTASIAASAIISLGIYPVVELAGITPVTTISNGWNGRRVTLVPKTGSISFTLGGNLCNSLISMRNVPVEAFYDGTCWHLK